MTVQDTEKHKIKTRPVFKYLGLAIVLLIFVVAYFGENDTNTYTSQIPIPKQDETLDDIGAYIEGKDYIEQFLKSPASAIFPPLGLVNRLNNNRYEVIAYVDSQNSFGALIRSSWNVVFQYQNEKTYLEKIRPEKIRLQIKYIKERSFWLDIKVIILTILKIFK